MPFNPEAVQVLRGKCPACNVEVRWARPRGCAVMIGVFKREDATEIIPEKSLSGGELIVGLKQDAEQHTCRIDRSGTDYRDRYAKWKAGDKSIMGTPKPFKRRHAKPKGTPHTREVAPGVTSNVPTPPPFKPGQVSEQRKHASAPPPLGAASSVPPPVTQPQPDNGPPAEKPKPKRKPKAQYAKDLLPREAIEGWERIDGLVKWIRRPLVLEGPPATGKTSYVVRLCRSHGWLVVNVTMTPEMPAAELLGTQALVNGSFEWQDGALLYAWRQSHNQPTILLLNEVENAGPDAEVGLHLGLDDADVAEYRVPHTGEVVRPHAWDPDNGKGFRAIATTNNELTALSVGVQSRLKISAMCAYPHPELVDSLESEQARRLLCAHTREYDIRTVMAWDEAMRDGCPRDEAAYLVFGKQSGQSLLDAIKIDEASR